MKTKSTPEPGDLRERALRLLAQREHSRAELARKLDLAGFSSTDISPVLDDFEKKSWLSDQRFAESYVADHRARAGSIKLAYDLRLRGVPDSIVEAVLSDNRESELERAHTIWKKKFGARPADVTEKSKQIRFMQGRGFAQEIIQKVMRGTE